MSLTDQLLAALLLHGLPVLFGIIAIASVGVPLPASLMLVAAGAFVEQGEMELWPVIAVASAAAVLGDQMGYGLARWGGRHFIARIGRRLGGESKIRKAEALSMRWGGAGIFVSRWLVTGLGPWLNITSGIAAYPWPRFLFWDILGEVLWVFIFVMLGYVFSDRVQAMAEVLGSLTWVILGLIATAILGWRVVRYFRPEKAEDQKGAEILAGGDT
jgi:membrane protein DedA with SNARE-associated domain